METELFIEQETTATLEDCEAVIERGMMTFVEVGNALRAIRDDRLYAADHETFEDYCTARWGWTIRQGNRMIAGAGVVENLGPIGPKPENESQARPLVKLSDPEEQRAAWEEAVQEAETKGEPVTARVVEQAVERRAGKSGGDKSTARKMNQLRPFAARINIDPQDPEWSAKNIADKFGGSFIEKMADEYAASRVEEVAK